MTLQPTSPSPEGLSLSLSFSVGAGQHPTAGHAVLATSAPGTLGHPVSPACPRSLSSSPLPWGPGSLPQTLMPTQPVPPLPCGQVVCHPGGGDQHLPWARPVTLLSPMTSAVPLGGLGSKSATAV